MAWTPAIDIFAVALILFELRFGEPFVLGCRGDDQHQLAIFHLLIGPMSDKMAREGARNNPDLFKKNKEGKLIINVRRFMDEEERNRYIVERRRRKVSIRG